jgi:CBS domain-containing protein
MTNDTACLDDAQSALCELLARHAPFAQMAESDRQFLAAHLTMQRYAAGEAIAAPEDGPAQHLFIVEQGRVSSSLRAGFTEERIFDMGPGDCFPIASLIAERPVNVVLRACGEAICYRLPRQDFETLRQRSPELQNFCARRLACLLDLALKDRDEPMSQREGGGQLARPLGGLVRREPVVCTPDTALSEALEQMRRERVGSIVAVDGEQRPLGVFTLHDLLGRVALAAVPLDRPLTDVMTPTPATLDAAQSAFSAVLLMAERGFGHVCIVEGGRLIGVLSERDLFSLRRLSLARLRRAIALAADLGGLARLARDVHTLVDQMLGHGASVEQLTQIIAALNDHITRRAIELILQEVGPPRATFSWLAFGSEGREEQTLKTDQDNGILFQVPPGATAGDIRAELLPFADRVNDALQDCGFPRCSGGVMASNPDWCLSQEEWAQKFADWVNRADGKRLLYATIFFDFRTLYGPPEPVEDLRRWLLGMVHDHRNFFRRMVELALSIRPPLGLFRDFVVQRGGDATHTLDLKLNGITPFVDAGRIFALYAGIGETNTAQRLRAAGTRWRLDPAEIEAWLDGFHHIQFLRLCQHRKQAQQGKSLTNLLAPDDLNELERQFLKEAFLQARKLQRQLEQFFQF